MPFIELIVALSGPVGSGKTTLGTRISAREDARRLSTRHVLVQHALREATTIDRRSLQKLGDLLDAQTDGRWVAEAAREVGGAALIVIDSIRILPQLVALRSLAPIVHVHLTAPADVLAARYEERRRAAPQEELQSFEAVRAHPVEAAVDGLAPVADITVDTSILAADAVLEAVRPVIERRS